MTPFECAALHDGHPGTYAKLAFADLGAFAGFLTCRRERDMSTYQDFKTVAILPEPLGYKGIVSITEQTGVMSCLLGTYRYTRLVPSSPSRVCKLA